MKCRNYLDLEHNLCLNHNLITVNQFLSTSKSSLPIQSKKGKIPGKLSSVQSKYRLSLLLNCLTQTNISTLSFVIMPGDSVFLSSCISTIRARRAKRLKLISQKKQSKKVIAKTSLSLRFKNQSRTSMIIILMKIVMIMPTNTRPKIFLQKKTSN